MRPQFTFVFVFLFCFSLSAQVKFNVGLLPDNVSYQVSLKPDVTWTAPQNTVLSSQVTVRVPTGGFEFESLISQAGNWAYNGTIVAPMESPGYDYLYFGLQGVATGIPFASGSEVALFTFKNKGACTGILELIENETDPFWPPNSQSVNIGNQISVIGAGNGVNAYTGNYGAYPANCQPPSNYCGIKVFNVKLKNPSTCGVADGRIEIVAESDASLPLQYTINGGSSWFNDPVFENLASGYTFYIRVRDKVALCEVNVGSFYLNGPLPGVVTGYERVNPSCNESNGSLTINAYAENGNTLNYGLSQYGPWQTSSTFNGLAEGNYSIYLKNINNNCIGLAGTYTLTEDCSTDPEDPEDPGDPCLITFEIEKLVSNEFQVSMIADTTWTFPFNITASMQVTIKVPTGGFVVSNITNKISGVVFSLASNYSSPAEDPEHDYISFILDSPGTTNIPYQKGEKTALFTFKNSGACQGKQVILMADSDPFFPPNSENANVGQQITVSGYGGADTPVCISNLSAEDCTSDPCASLAPGFTLGADLCEGVSYTFTNTTTSIEPLTSWNWDFGDGSAPSNVESPSHTYSISGNFEVSLTVTTEGGCEASFSEIVTVFSTPLSAPSNFYSICSGDTVQLHAPSGVNAIWSPAASLSDSSDPNPFAFPSSTTIYTLTSSNSHGCVHTEEVTVEVKGRPAINSVTTSHPTNCSELNGKITIYASGSGSFEYSIDNGVSWQNSPNFSNLAPGDYYIIARNASGACDVAFTGNPVTLYAPAGPVLVGISVTQPSGCIPDGAIKVKASGGTPPLLYSIDGGTTFQQDSVFTGMAAGAYIVVVANADSSCFVSPVTPVILISPAEPEILLAASDINLCEGGGKSITIKVSQELSSYHIYPDDYQNDTMSDSTLTFTVLSGSAGIRDFTVELTTTFGCTLTDEFTLTTTPKPIPAFLAPSVTCVDGQAELSFTGSAGSDAVLTWSLSGGSIVSASAQTGTEPDSAHLTVTWASTGSKIVSLTIADHGCTATGIGSIDIEEFNPEFDFVLSPTSCGEANGAIELSFHSAGAENYSYLWDNGATSKDLSGLSAGAYTVTITESGTGCSIEGSATVSASEALSIADLESSAATDCSGVSGDGSLSLTVYGGAGELEFTLYELGDSTVLINQLTTTVPHQTFDNLSVGAYIIEVTDASGCFASVTTAIEPGIGGLSADTHFTDVTCGQANGSISIGISGGQQPVQYDFYKNNTLLSEGNPLGDSLLSFDNLEAAAYVLIFRDANGCTLPVVVTLESNDMLISSTTQLASTCGAEDGWITLQVIGGSSPYLLSSNLGIAPEEPFSNTATITGLSEGVVNIILEDANGCIKSLDIDLGEITKPELDASSLLVTDVLCPDGFGSIISTTGQQYFIYNSDDVLVGLTPWEIAPAGDYKVVYSIGGCEAELSVTVLGAEAWEVDSDTQPETCEGNDGSISLFVSGANGEYTYLWNNGDTTAISENLNSSEFYEVTITDALGCSTILTGLQVEYSCVTIPCEDIFYIDTFIVALQPGLTEICLPTNKPTLAGYEPELNGSPYGETAGGCVESSHFYNYGTLASLGAPPYLLESWSFNGTSVDSVEFEDVRELVNVMNTYDPLGNWALDTIESSIVGGLSGRNYSSLTILVSNTTLTLPLATVSVTHPGIFVSDSLLTHVLVVTDLLTGCSDTLYINLIDNLEPDTPNTDTISIDIAVGEILSDFCLDTTELSGAIEYIVNDCESETESAQVDFTDDYCLEITGIEEGVTQACIVICDEFGVCDTTILIINVADNTDPEGDRELIIYTGFSPNNDGVNDFFKIKNIEYYPDNELIVFNRWGNRIYQTTSYTNADPWTGRFGDRILPDGSYFYLLNVVIDGQNKRFSGLVELRR